MARSSARRSIKRKGRRALRRRPCLATAGEVERRRNYAKAIVNPMTIRVCTPPITGPGLCFLPPDGHGHERFSESASRNLARSRPGGISSSQRISNMNLFEPRSRNHGLPVFCHPDWCRSDTISKFRFEIWNPQNVRRCRVDIGTSGSPSKRAASPSRTFCLSSKREPYGLLPFGISKTQSSAKNFMIRSRSCALNASHISISLVRISICALPDLNTPLFRQTNVLRLQSITSSCRGQRLRPSGSKNGPQGNDRIWCQYATLQHFTLEGCTRRITPAGFSNWTERFSVSRGSLYRASGTDLCEHRQHVEVVPGALELTTLDLDDLAGRQFDRLVRGRNGTCWCL